QHQVEIIQQPLASRRNAAFGFDRPRKQFACLDQYPFVAGQARQQAICASRTRIAVQAGKKLAMLFQLVGTVQLRPQRRFNAVWRLSRLRPASRFPLVPYVFGNHEKLASRLQRSAGVNWIVGQSASQVCALSNIGHGNREDRDCATAYRASSQIGAALRYRGYLRNFRHPATQPIPRTKSCNQISTPPITRFPAPAPNTRRLAGGAAMPQKATAMRKAMIRQIGTMR